MKKITVLLLLILLLASCDRKPDIAYLDACAHPDALKEIKYYVKHKLSNADGLLIAAEKNKNEKIVKELLKSKNIEENEKLQALWRSMENKNIEVFKVLLNDTKGANSCITKTKETILMRACESNKKKIVKILIENDANVNAQDERGKTAIMVAFEEGNKEIVNALLAAGADVNIKDKNGTTLLMTACEKGNLDLVNAFIEAKADVNVQDENGKTALMIACEKGNKDIVNALIKAGSDIKIKDNKGATALIYSLTSIEIKNIILKAGADSKEIETYFELKMVPIPGRNFEMLSTEVTQKLYKAIMGTNPSYFLGDNLPVECVSWYDAVKFCNALSQKMGLILVYTINGKNVIQNTSADGFRLPTVEEWQYAAEGGQNYTYAGSNNIDDVAWYNGNSGEKTHPVAQKKANGYGLYDMSGNVWEWCWDVFLGSDDNRFTCGGSWYNYADIYRGWINADGGFNSLGFRPVRNIK